MKAAVMYAVNEPLVVEEIELDPPKDREVLVRYAASGVCHSDLHIMRGSIPRPMPMVLGHEGAGIVEAVGPNVTLVKPGDHVVLSWVPSCGVCHSCTTGRMYLCDTAAQFMYEGLMLDGTIRMRKGAQRIRHMNMLSTFAERAIVPESACIPIRKDMPLDRAALLGCAVMTGVGAALNTARVEAGSAVAVFGCGGVGLNVVQGAALAGAGRIIAVDLLDNKLNYARTFGATHTINAAREDPIARIKELTDGAGADYAFDAVGHPQLVRQGFEATRRGGTVIIIGMMGPGVEFSIPGRPFVAQEKRILASFYGSGRLRVDVPRLADLYLAGKLKLDELISRRFALEEINTAFEALERGEVARGVIMYS